MRTVLIAYQLAQRLFSSAQILRSMTSYIFRNGLCDSDPQRMRCLTQEVDCSRNPMTINPKELRTVTLAPMELSPHDHPFDRTLICTEKLREA